MGWIFAAEASYMSAEWSNFTITLHTLRTYKYLVNILNSSAKKGYMVQKQQWKKLEKWSSILGIRDICSIGCPGEQKYWKKIGRTVTWYSDWYGSRGLPQSASLSRVNKLIYYTFTPGMVSTIQNKYRKTTTAHSSLVCHWRELLSRMMIAPDQST